MWLGRSEITSIGEKLAERIVAERNRGGLCRETAHAAWLLDERRAFAIEKLQTCENGRRIEVGGVVTHRSRPATASSRDFR